MEWDVCVCVLGRVRACMCEKKRGLRFIYKKSLGGCNRGEVGDMIQKIIQKYGERERVFVVVGRVCAVWKGEGMHKVTGREGICAEERGDMLGRERERERERAVTCRNTSLHIYRL